MRRERKGYNGERGYLSVPAVLVLRCGEEWVDSVKYCRGGLKNDRSYTGGGNIAFADGYKIKKQEVEGGKGDRERRKWK